MDDAFGPCGLKPSATSGVQNTKHTTCRDRMGEVDTRYIDCWDNRITNRCIDDNVGILVLTTSLPNITTKEQKDVSKYRYFLENKAYALSRRELDMTRSYKARTSMQNALCGSYPIIIGLNAIGYLNVHASSQNPLSPSPNDVPKFPTTANTCSYL